ncbi:MAG: helix-turn-helix transcriptional regulator [Clostridia bacterium]|nr:helix-turn-helix transcriptional regulator [Clostridia bacterium]
MEKKTIGKFIAVLRKAHGMTQKELGDRLYVSDKTVSRWERDECTPELALIPVIAEIFGITTDELLRGERNTTTGEGTVSEAAAETVAYQKKKSDKQWKSLLHRRMTTYKNLTYLSVGLPIVGLLGAAIANLALTRGLVGFCIAAAFVLASVICQLCFASNAKMPVDEDEEDTARTDDLITFNDRVLGTAVKVMFFDLSVLSFCMPIMRYSHFGLGFGSWLLEGTVFLLLALVLGWAVYAFAIRPTLIKGGSLSPDSEDTVTRRRAWYRTLRKHVIAGTAIAVVLCVLSAVAIELPGQFFVKPLVFEDKESFQKFMWDEALKTREDEAREEGYWDEDGFYVNVEIATELVIGSNKQPSYSPDKDGIKYAECRSLSGDKVLFTYAYVPDYRVRFDIDNEDRMPVKVYKEEALNTAYAVLEGVSVGLLTLVAADALVIILLLVKQRKKIYYT